MSEKINFKEISKSNCFESVRKEFMEEYKSIFNKLDKLVIKRDVIDEMIFIINSGYDVKLNSKVDSNLSKEILEAQNNAAIFQARETAYTILKYKIEKVLKIEDTYFLIKLLYRLASIYRVKECLLDDYNIYDYNIALVIERPISKSYLFVRKDSLFDENHFLVSENLDGEFSVTEFYSPTEDELEVINYIKNIEV